MKRYPAVAGQFYPGFKDDLTKQIERCFLHELGPGELPPDEKDNEKVFGGVVPHAGYVYSGPIAAHFYYELSKHKKPDTFIILGPNHRGVGTGVAITIEDFLTPLAMVKTDIEMAKILSRDIIDIDILAHKYEHSIEVQLPFLQYIFSDIKIVAISMMYQDYNLSMEVGKIIKEEISDKNVVVIASSDFSHYVPKKMAYKNDLKSVEYILKNDSRSFFDSIHKYNVSACGIGPITAMMNAVDREGKLLKYATSGDIMPSKDVVGYASIKM